MGTLGYIGIIDLIGTTNRYYDTFAEDLYGSSGSMLSSASSVLISDIDSAFNEINDILRSTGGRFSVMPVPKDRNGNFPQALQDWNAYLVIYNKLLSRFAVETEDIPESISIYGSRADRISKRVVDGAAIFPEEIDAGELGIGAPQLVGALGSNTRGTFQNSWQGFPYGDRTIQSFHISRFSGPVTTESGFTGNDFPRTWIIEVDTAGGIGTGKYKWSNDSGVTFTETGVNIDDDWYLLKDNVWIRFEADDSGSHEFSVPDRWKFQTVPVNIRRTFSDTEAKFGEIRRGF